MVIDEWTRFLVIVRLPGESPRKPGPWGVHVVTANATEADVEYWKRVEEEVYATVLLCRWSWRKGLRWIEADGKVDTGGNYELFGWVDHETQLAEVVCNALNDEAIRCSKAIIV